LQKLENSENSEKQQTENNFGEQNPPEIDQPLRFCTTQHQPRRERLKIPTISKFKPDSTFNPTLYGKQLLKIQSESTLQPAKALQTLDSPIKTKQSQNSLSRGLNEKRSGKKMIEGKQKTTLPTIIPHKFLVRDITDDQYTVSESCELR